jgi:23S rRNA (pseudouridine1915-N3)-methyltransferase
MKTNKIELVCVGDLKFKGLKEVEKKYLEKINFFTRFGISRTKDVKSSDDVLKKKKEGEMIMGMLDRRDFVIALDEHGKKMDSIEFSTFLGRKLSDYPDRIVFLVGGHAGLSQALDERINFKLSFSAMTFGHDVFRILFLEQLYRAFTIIDNIKYHR